MNGDAAIDVFTLDVGWDNFWLQGVFSTLELAKAAQPDLDWQEVQDGDVWEADSPHGPARINRYRLDRSEER